MAFEGEACGCEGGEAAGAALNLEHAITDAAVEMMMVAFAGKLKAGAFAGDFNGDDKICLGEEFERAVDGGQAEVLYFGLCMMENLAGGEGRANFGKHVADSVALAGVTFSLVCRLACGLGGGLACPLGSGLAAGSLGGCRWRA